MPHARTRFTTDRLVQVERPAKKMRGARTRATTPRLQPRTYAHLLGLIWQTGHAAAVDSVSARRVWPGLVGSSNEAAGLEHMKIKLPDPNTYGRRALIHEHSFLVHHSAGVQPCTPSASPGNATHPRWCFAVPRRRGCTGEAASWWMQIAMANGAVHFASSAVV